MVEVGRTGTAGDRIRPWCVNWSAKFHNLSRFVSPTIALLAAAMVFIRIDAVAQSPGGQVPSLVVTPPSGMAFSGPMGGPFSPAAFQYRVRASAGTIRYSVRTP